MAVFHRYMGSKLRLLDEERDVEDVEEHELSDFTGKQLAVVPIPPNPPPVLDNDKMSCRVMMVADQIWQRINWCLLAALVIFTICCVIVTISATRYYGEKSTALSDQNEYLF